MPPDSDGRGTAPARGGPLRLPRERPPRARGGEARTVAKAADVLLCFTAARPAWRTSELSRQLGMSKTIVHRLLGTLQRKGFLVRNAADLSFSPGPAVLQLAAAFVGRGDLIAKSQGPMRELAETLGETVMLSVRLGDHRICVHQIESQHALRYTMPSHHPLPLYGGSTGKLLLASLSDPEIGAYLARTPLSRQAPRTIVDPRRLLQEVRRIRRQGFAVSVDEGSAGAVGLAAFIQGPGGTVLGALTVTAPKVRLPARRFPDVARLVTTHAARISARMGWLETASQRNGGQHA
jgi:DNA-binding IclR family transcriptional regulator